jgi:ketosteroid isomerase-like protein
MSQEDVKIVRSNYDHLNEVGEPNREIYVPDLVADGSRLPGFGIYQDLDAFLAAWLEYRNTFDEWWIEVEEVLDGQGERVFAAVRDGGRMKSSRSEVRNRLFHVWELREGKIVALTVFLDRTEALEAVGLRE